MYYSNWACFHCKEDHFYVNSNLRMNWRIVTLLGYFCLFSLSSNIQLLSRYEDMIFVVILSLILSLYYIFSKKNLVSFFLICIPILGLYITHSSNSFLDERIYAMISSLNSERLSYTGDDAKREYYKEIQKQIDGSFQNEPSTSLSMMVEIDRDLSAAEMVSSKILNYSIHNNSNPLFISSINLNKSFFEYLKKSFFVIFFPILLSFIVFNLKITNHIFLVLIILVGLLAVFGSYYRFQYLQGLSLEGREILGIWTAPEPRIIFSSFTYKNHWSAYVILILSTSLYSLHNIIHSQNFSFFRSKKFNIVFVVIVLLVFSIFYSSSNSGILFVFLFLLASSGLMVPKKRFSVAMITISVVSVSLIFTNTLLINRIRDLFTGDSFRFHLWKDIINQIQIKTFWGYGIDSYETINGLFQSSEITNARYLNLQNAHQQYIPLTVHAHSDLLQTLSEIGFIGFCTLIFPVFFVLIKTLMTSSRHSIQYITIALNVIMLYSIVDFPFRNIAVSSMFIFLFSIILLSQNHRIAFRLQ